MTEQELKAEADKAQQHLELAIRKVSKIRAGMCELASKDKTYSEAVTRSNDMLSDLHAAHTHGIEMLMLAPSDIITPQFGGK